MAATVETITMNGAPKQRTVVLEKSVAPFDQSVMASDHSEKLEKVASHGVPRANVTAAREAPNSTTKDKFGYINRKKTVLEQHCQWFDRDGDGVIWPTDTWRTVREFGWSIPLSIFFTCFLHGVQSWGTVPWFFLIPDPFFRVWIHNIHRNKHGSCTQAFDNQGRFRPQFLDEFFEQNDPECKGGVTFWDGYQGLRNIHYAWDIFGQISAFFEWGMTYVLLWPEDGIVRKEDARRVIDGSIFHEMTVPHRKYNILASQQVKA